ncbi:hypothetical protein V1463_01320 [Micrococcus yunnanensis]|uniref:hypothetical protein n=1 Tax=Micrococcus yunnanensis TaxID=566027 RepID=UPI00300DE634
MNDPHHINIHGKTPVSSGHTYREFIVLGMWATFQCGEFTPENIATALNTLPARDVRAFKEAIHGLAHDDVPDRHLKMANDVGRLNLVGPAPEDSYYTYDYNNTPENNTKLAKALHRYMNRARPKPRKIKGLDK